MTTDEQLISEYRQQRIAALERLIEGELAADYEVFSCVCAGDPVRRRGAQFCGDCGRLLERKEPTP